MAKGRIPPRKNIGKTVKSIIARGKRTQPEETLKRGRFKNFVDMVKKSRIPHPPQNQRGKVLAKQVNDLTR